MIKYLQFGFSLIELMVVIAIISILATVAIPSYQNYALRARFSEIISATEPFKIAISLALQQNIPESELTNGIHNIPNSPMPTQNLANIKVENGIITATATHKANDLTYILKPDAKGNIWQVEGSCIAAGVCESK